MGSNRFRIVLTVLFCAGASSAARAQPVALPPALPGSAADVLPAPAAGKAPGGGQVDPPSSPPEKAAKEKGSLGVGEAMELSPPPLEAGDLRFPINLGTALRLADDRPLIIAAAQASAWKAEARLQQTKVIGIPTFNLGVDYIRHDGFGPDTNLGLNVPRGINA